MTGERHTQKTTLPTSPFQCFKSPSSPSSSEKKEGQHALGASHIDHVRVRQKFLHQLDVARAQRESERTVQETLGGGFGGAQDHDAAAGYDGSKRRAQELGDSAQIEGDSEASS